MRLPDEDAFALTPEQLAAAAPRRGGRSARPFTMRPNDTEWWRRAGIEARREVFLAAITAPSTEPPIAAALRRYLDGGPDPVGAAAAFLASDAAGSGLWLERGYSQYDAWLGEHSTEFAATAVMEYFTLRTAHPSNRRPFDPDRDHADRFAIVRAPADCTEGPARNLLHELRQLRTHLSTLPEDEYRRIEAVLEHQGREPYQRRARAFAMPERTDWVEQTCAEQPAWPFRDSRHRGLLLESVASIDQLAKAGVTGLPRGGDHARIVASLLDAVGPDIVPVILDADVLAWSDPEPRDHLIDVLATLPRDEAVRYFLGRIEEHREQPRLRQVADRFPVRTLRAITDLAEDADTVRRARFVALVRSSPLLDGPARDALDPADRDRIDGLLAWRGLPPETADAPAALAEPPRLQPHRRIPRAPDWAPMVTAIPLLTKGRTARLPQAAAGHLLAALALDTAKHPHPAVEAAIEHCDPASLREFSWAVFATWNLAGDRANPWAFTQLSRFADDGVVHRLAALVGEWPGQGLHKRAVRGLEMLGAIGTEEALTAVHRLSRQAAFKGLKKAASAEVDRIAARLGLDQDRLLDRLVPDVELDAEGRMTLDFGPRSFSVGFDEQLRPLVVEPGGRTRRSLPKPAAGDDPEAAAAAAARFERLKRGLKSVGTEQVRRMERAMTGGRVWSRPDFERYVAGHALMRHLARRLVWQYTTGKGWTAFRIAEDGGFADLRDDELRLPERSAVRLPHPLHLGAEAAAWAELLADYEVVQPFAQLDRRVFTLTREEAATGRVARFEGRVLPAKVLTGLARGRTRWKYTQAFSGRGGSGTYGLCRELADGGFLMLDLDPGIGFPVAAAAPEQRLRAVRFTTEEAADAPALRGLDPVPVSELLALLDGHAVR
ncbi:hypothetical protein GCM10009830_49230 [Glycomyces endophyticus]|uniref:DUF4132 domain-containing protein n=1 Tax=Glycomyces endophyticus TaxID=480996 RepID=A0ABP4TXD7_9ACTN